MTNLTERRFCELILGEAQAIFHRCGDVVEEGKSDGSILVVLAAETTIQNERIAYWQTQLDNIGDEG